MLINSTIPGQSLTILKGLFGSKDLSANLLASTVGVVFRFLGLSNKEGWIASTFCPTSSSGGIVEMWKLAIPYLKWQADCYVAETLQGRCWSLWNSLFSLNSYCGITGWPLSVLSKAAARDSIICSPLIWLGAASIHELLGASAERVFTSRLKNVPVNWAALHIWSCRAESVQWAF